MNRFLSIGVLLSALLSILEVASAAGIPAPALKAGQFVYAVPQGFDPPLIGKAGIDEIQTEARKRRFPYYVVLAKDYGGSSTQELSDALDTLVDEWSKNPRFNRATSSVAVLTYSPRKFRLLAGSKWRATLGLEGQDGGQRFVDIFSSYVQGSSKDPKTGIIESMKALDNFVFEQTDPKLLAARAEAARKAEAERKLREIRDRLNRQITRVEALLSDTAFLPPNTSEPRTALAQANVARSADNPTSMTAATSTLQAEGDTLEQQVRANRRAYQDKLDTQTRRQQMALAAQAEKERQEGVERLKFTSLLLGSFFLLVGLLYWQWRRYKTASTAFQEKTRVWDEALLNAANNHTRFFEERQSVAELANTAGKTKEKYDEVTREVGGIYPTIEAMRDRVEECKRIFQQGSFLRTKPMREALTLLDADFEFDTETMNRKSLFEPPVRIIKIKPAQLQEQINHTYAENITDWDELMLALQLRQTIAQDAFPSSELTRMLDLASQKGIPHRWLSTHPLFGDDESDRHYYDDLNALRVDDPLAYKQGIDFALQAQTEQNALLARLIDAVVLVESKRVRVLPAYGNTIVSNEDDPNLTLAAAFRADERLTGFLATKTEVAEVEEQARDTADLYQKAVLQATTIQAAIEGAEGDIAALASRRDGVQQLFSKAQERLQRARAVHAETGGGASLLENGRLQLEAASDSLEKSRRLLEEKRHLDAQNRVQQANRDLTAAEKEFNQCLAFCDELDEQKRAYDLRLAGLAAARLEAEASLRRYGGGRRLADYNPGLFSGPANYGQLMAQIVSYQQQMDSEVRRARRAYEEEQARLERQREQERQRQRDEERRRSSSSSSSGSNWGGGSSSSSGRSWSGGSSSSSGTDW